MLEMKTLQYLLVVEKGGNGMTKEEIVNVSGLPENDVYMTLKEGVKSRRIILSRDGQNEVYMTNQSLVEERLK